MKNKRLSISVFIFIFCVVFVIVFSMLFLYLFCPIKYSQYVDKYANEFGLDKALVYAIMYTESGCNRYAQSSAGAIGLMQLMPATASDMANMLGISDYDLTDADTNIRLGCAYYAHLLNIFDNNETNAICAYNAGPNTVQKWLKNENKTIGVDVQNIEYDETKNYLIKVKRRSKTYRWKLNSIYGA